MRSHTPSYVDETLFGPKPVEPSFKAPWEDESSNRLKQHLTWSPPKAHVDSPRSDTSFDDRPGSRLVNILRCAILISLLLRRRSIGRR